MLRTFTRHYSQVFKPGDVALARHVLQPDKIYLSKPLVPGKVFDVGKFKISHDEILGQTVRTTITPSSAKPSKGPQQKYILTYPTMEEFLLNRRRDAQPIYPLDAAAIVSLADIHVDETTEGVQQFLEAGTGHGSLTLAISRMLHAANGEARAAKRNQPQAASEPNPEGSEAASTDSTGPELRKAILHSIDRNHSFSRTGRHNVRDFRHGMYRDNVEFHVCESPEAWLTNNETSGSWKALANTSNFLHGAFLDLPSPDSSIDAIARHLAVNAPLVVFCPSVSQIQNMVEHVRVCPDLDLTLVNTVELMPGMGGGSLRAWDIRSTVARSTGEVVRVCRPRVGNNMVSGGGFVAVFRKLQPGAMAELAKLKEQEAREKEAKRAEQMAQKDAEEAAEEVKA
ncbi:hypothetical protein DV454_001144 [Geotrichum candidum]|nr:hypothetical protein DV454_001144 [Geotrichum candidum]